MKFDNKGVAVVVGNFDGVHLGHLHLLSILKSEAQKRGLKPLAVTFHPHPATVLQPEKHICEITSPEEKKELIEDTLGVELKIETFTEEFSKIPPQEFITDYLIERYGASLIVVGYDWHFGKDASGNYQTVKEVCKKHNCEVIKVEPYRVGGKVVSSSLVRELLKKADLKMASLYLGRCYWVRRSVTKGKGLGSKMGFPTINLGGVDKLCLPSGVYAVTVEGKPAIAYLGTAPTLKNENERILEVHILKGDPHEVSEKPKVVFYRYLRGEFTFKNAEQLARQVKKDIEEAKKLFLIA